MRPPAGDTVAWGEETRGGAVRVLRGAPGAPPQVVHEIPAATAARTRRGFMSLASSFASSAQASEQAAIGGALPGPGALLGGTIPEFVGAGCEGRYDQPTGPPGRIVLRTL